MPDPTPISGLPSDSTLALSDVVIVNHDNGDGTFTTERATLTEVQTVIGGGGGGGGVPSVNGITGAVSIVSPDDSVDVAVVGDEIQLTTSGGGGGGTDHFADLVDVNIGTQGIGKFLTLTDASLTLVQRLESNAPGLSGGGASDASFVDPPTAGNLIVVVVAYNSGGTAPTVPTGFTSRATSGGESTSLLLFTKISDGAADQTLSLDHEVGESLIMEEWSGAVWDCTPVTATGATTGTQTIPAGAVAVAALGNYVGGQGTAEDGWTQYYQYGGDNSNYGNGTLLAEKSYSDETADVSYTFTASSYTGLANCPTILYYISPASSQPYVFKYINGGDASYDSVILSQSPTHYWPLNDAAGSSTAADSVGSQPLTVIDDTTVLFGVSGLIVDNETCVAFIGDTPVALQMPAACQPTEEFSLTFVHAGAQSGRTLFDFGSASGVFGFGAYTNASQVGAPYACLLNDINWYYSSSAYSLGPAHIAITWDGSVCNVFVNGSQIFSSGLSLSYSTTTGSVGGSSGRMAKVGLWNGTVLTQGQILAQVAAAGL